MDVRPDAAGLAVPFDELDTWLHIRADADEFSGVVLVRRDAVELFAGAYGPASRRWPVPNTMGTRFDTASITKIFTAVAALQLVGEGRLSLDAPITSVVNLAGTTVSSEVTLRYLLTHTSGLADDADEEAGEDYEALWIDKPVYSVIETRDYLPQFAYKPPLFAPGTRCRYCNVGYILVGLAIEAATGMPYRSYVQRAAFDRAGMAASGFFDRRSAVPDVAEGWDPVLDDSGVRTGWKQNIFSYPSIGSPDGGAHATAGDLVGFMQAVRAGRLLPAELTEAFLTPQVLHHEGEGMERSGEAGTHDGRGAWSVWYGYGLEFVRDRGGTVRNYYKDGLNAGASGIVRYYPDPELDVVVLSNNSVGAMDVVDEVHRIIQTDHPVVGDSGF